MKIDLTEEQYKQLKEDGVLDISAPGDGIQFYIEYNSRRDYALNFEELEKLKAKKPYDPSWYHDKPLCPNCNTYMIYNFEHCPKCGQKIDWSGFTGER